MPKEEFNQTDARYSLEAFLAQLFVIEVAMWATCQAVQIRVGMRYREELPVERYFRDAKITEI